MKKIWNVVLMATVALFTCNCGGGEENGEPGPNPNEEKLEVTKDNLVGEWKLTKLSNQTDFPDQTHTIYVEFLANGTFKLYQQNINYQGVVLFTGNFSLNETTKVIAGIYSDGENWGANYEISELTTSSMIWKVEGGNETQNYIKESIPGTIIDSARPLEEVRSLEEIFRLF